MNLLFKRSFVSLLLLALVFVLNSPNASAATLLSSWNSKPVYAGKNNVAYAPSFSVNSGQSISMRFDLTRGPLNVTEKQPDITFVIKNATTDKVLDTIRLTQYYGGPRGDAFATREYTNLRQGTYTITIINNGPGSVYSGGGVWGS